MIKKYRITMLTITLMVMPVLAQAETLTMTTYYPSPFGVYQSLRLAPNASPPACSVSTTGTMYVDVSGDLQFCDGTSYTNSVGEWTLDGTDLYPISWSTADIGIGTNIPATKLHVQSAATDFTAIRIQNTDAADSVWELRAHQTSLTDGFSIWGGAEGAEAFRLGITSAGNVGIGTTSPTSELEVNGDVELTNDLIFNGANPAISTTNGDLAIAPGGGFDVHSDIGGGAQFYVYDADNASHLLTILQSTRRIGVLNAAPTTEFDVNGTVTANAYLYSSDARLKENFKPVLGLSGIKQIEGLSYTWKENGQQDIGITAQDVEKVYPELVHTDETSGRKYVKYGNLIAPMIEAIKEQQVLIEHQSEEIDSLRKEINQIKRGMEMDSSR
ncbi:MAG: tail fiber domain-containing protein [Candidatus Omnitrophota bacterium]